MVNFRPQTSTLEKFMCALLRTPHMITPVLEGVCRCKAKAGLRHLSRGFHTRTRLPSLLKYNLDSSLKMTCFHSVVVQSRRSPR
ncbi:hypothetical protein TNCV_4070401 [Trichonephila clavipes]|nr:hypothetical protein TNCV_4070401 [Trichonephila clavipes]